MGNLVGKVVSALSIAMGCFCVATVLVQAVLVGSLVTGGTLAPEKALRYAAVVYGLDMTHLPADSDLSDEEPSEELKTRDELVDERARNSTILQSRGEAIVMGNAKVRSVFGVLQLESNRFEERKREFDKSLNEQEKQARAAAIRSVEQTLAVLRPKQAKELILKMLEDRGIDPDDDVMADLVSMIKEMPLDKSKKLFGAFKSKDEKEKLHEILVEMSPLNAG